MMAKADVVPGMATPQRGFRRLLRTMRVLSDHCAAVERVADDLGRRGLPDLADELRMETREVRRHFAVPESKLKRAKPA